jgi:hypothetical protein
MVGRALVPMKFAGAGFAALLRGVRLNANAIPGGSAS